MMVQRCTNPKATKYPRYGAIGVRVSEAWLSFPQFLADMGKRPTGTTLDRFPNNGGHYEPGNCRWATITEQQRNTRSNVLVMFKGRTQCINAWGAELGITPSVLSYRIRAGWGDRAFTEPVKYGNRVVTKETARAPLSDGALVQP